MAKVILTVCIVASVLASATAFSGLDYFRQHVGPRFDQALQTCRNKPMDGCCPMLVQWIDLTNGGCNLAPLNKTLDAAQRDVLCNQPCLVTMGYSAGSFAGAQGPACEVVGMLSPFVAASCMWIGTDVCFQRFLPVAEAIRQSGEFIHEGKLPIPPVSSDDLENFCPSPCLTAIMDPSFPLGPFRPAFNFLVNNLCSKGADGSYCPLGSDMTAFWLEAQKKDRKSDFSAYCNGCRATAAQAVLTYTDHSAKNSSWPLPYFQMRTGVDVTPQANVLDLTCTSSTQRSNFGFQDSCFAKVNSLTAAAVDDISNAMKLCKTAAELADAGVTCPAQCQAAVELVKGKLGCCAVSGLMYLMQAQDQVDAYGTFAPLFFGCDSAFPTVCTVDRYGLMFSTALPFLDANKFGGVLDQTILSRLFYKDILAILHAPVASITINGVTASAVVSVSWSIQTASQASTNFYADQFRTMSAQNVTDFANIVAYYRNTPYWGSSSSGGGAAFCAGPIIPGLHYLPQIDATFRACSSSCNSESCVRCTPDQPGYYQDQYLNEFMFIQSGRVQDSAPCRG